MRTIFRTLLFWTSILCACSAGGLSPDASSSEPAVDIPSPFVIPVSTTEVLPPDKLIATVATPHIDQPPDGNVTTAAPADLGCAYQWAYEDLPQLSSDFQQSIQQLQTGAQASTFAFGENRAHADGRTDFVAMETDFNVTLQVTDPSNEPELGGWIVKVMQLIDKIPKEMIVGPRPGRVSISFQSSGDQMFANFYIDEYRSLPSGLSDAEIYQALQRPQ